MKKILSFILKRREINLLFLLIALIIFASIRSPRFIDPANLIDIIDDSSILIMVSMGMFIVILSGGIDLSIDSNIALTGMSVAMLNQYFPEIPIPVIILISLAIGLLLGSLNGFFISVTNIPPIITTLGTMSIYRGFVFLLCQGTWVSAHEMTEGFRNLPRGGIIFLSNLTIICIIVFVLFYIFIKFFKTGREIYAVGDNETAARYVGINFEKIRFIVFAICGTICGISGLLWVARYAAAQSETAQGFLLQPIAACLIGGVSIMGGVGRIWGVLLGAVFMGVLNNALTQIHISPFWQMAVQGFIILFAIIINTIMSKRNQEIILRKREIG